jgi:2'-5' RNA ligase
MAGDGDEDTGRDGADRLRLFIGVPVGEPARGALARLAAGLRAAGWRPATEAALHVTVRFLGDTPATLVPALGRAVTEAARACPGPFPVSLGAVVGLPRAERARVAAVRADVGAEDLGRLAGALDRALAPLGIARDGRPFLAHVTVARSGPRPRRVPEGRADAAFRAERLVLWESRLGRPHARYVERSACPLGPPA